MPTIEIGDEKFEVFPLGEPERTWYWQQIDCLAENSMNPWLCLYEKVRMLPANLQEIIFAGHPRKTLFPLTTQERTLLCCSPVAVQMLFQLATNAHTTEEEPQIERRDDLAAIDIYVDLLKALGESYTGVVREPQRLEGGAAMAFLAAKLKEEKEAEGKTDGVS